MNGIQFSSPDQIPLPPEEVQIIDFTVQVYPDGKRVKVVVTFTPFQENPSAEIEIRSPAGQILSSVDIIETMDTQTEITLHLPGTPDAGSYSAHLKAFYLQERSSPDHPDLVAGLKQEKIGERSTEFIIQ